MKTILYLLAMVGITVAEGQMVTKINSTFNDPCANPSRDAVLDAIKVVESRGSSQLYPHPDGVSWGVYGLTEIAVAELVRLDKLPAGKTLWSECSTEAGERRVAGIYLDVCLERARRPEVYGPTATYLHAALVYHGGTGEKLAPARVQYGRRLRRAIEEAAR